MDQTLRQAAAERIESKRQLYAQFLTSAIANPIISYSDKEKHLKTLTKLQDAHIEVLRALNQEPLPTPSHGIGSIAQTLQDRLTGEIFSRIDELAADLNAIGLTNLERMRTMMTPVGAEDLRPRIKPYGKRFISFVLD